MDPVQNPRRKTLISAVLLTIALVLGLVSVDLVGRAPLHNDFVEYWAAARVLLAGDNPYSPAAILAVEAPTGFAGKRPLLMFNPPWTLPFILPFGAISYGRASAVWLLFNLAIVFACADSLWREYGGVRQRRWLGWLLAASFFPLLTALGLGQIGPLILLGLTVFLRYQVSRPLLAGAATIVIAVKPQLLYLFWIVLLLECVRQRSWKLLAGSGGALLVASLLPALLRPGVWRDYLELASSGNVLRNPSPNLGTLLRTIFGDHAWLQFVPPLFGAVWAVLFWRAQRRRWNWSGQLPLLLLVSLVTTAYGWLFDEIVLLPAVMQVAVPLARNPGRLRRQALAIYVGVNALMALFVLVRETGTAYAWTAPAWLIVYVWLWWGIAAHSGPRGMDSGVATPLPELHRLS
ncbi:MAG TPA: glycosyltransferase family 87 protein [Terriglobales bacterium]|nr:glycosyltransferase family 87 protein [Terriglobales bacterium]